MKRIGIYIISAVTFLATGLVSADTYQFDKVHTQIFFSASHMGFSNPSGAFRDFDGKFVYNEASPEKSSVEVTINTASIDMNDDTWNGHLQSDKWLNVAEYPTMTYKSTSVKKTGENTLAVTGDLTLHGKTKPVTLDVTVNKVGDQMGKPKAGFSAKATLDRTAFDMTTFAPMIGANVDIRIQVEGMKQ